MNCPICKIELPVVTFAICTYWKCDKKFICIDGFRKSHYSQISYNKASYREGALPYSFKEYIFILPPFYVTSIDLSTTITMLKRTNCDEERYEFDKVISSGPSLSLEDSADLILNKLKLYAVFS